MTAKQMAELIGVLRASGVEHFKSADMEIRFAPAQANHVTDKPSYPSPNAAVASTSPGTAAAAPPVEMKIPHHVNEVAKLLKLSDNDLVDRMFPDHSPEIEVPMPDEVA